MEENHPYAEEEYIYEMTDELGDEVPDDLNFWDLEPFMDVGREPRGGAEVTRWTLMDDFFSHIAAHLYDLGFKTRGDGRDINLITKGWDGTPKVHRLGVNIGSHDLLDVVIAGENLLNGVTHVVLSPPPRADRRAGAALGHVARMRQRGGAKKIKKKKGSFKQKNSTNKLSGGRRKYKRTRKRRKKKKRRR